MFMSVHMAYTVVCNGFVVQVLRYQLYELVYTKIYGDSIN